MRRSDRAISDRTGAGGIVFGRWCRASVMLAPDDTPAPSQPEGSGTLRREGGTFDASSRRLGTDGGRLGSADEDKAC